MEILGVAVALLQNKSSPRQILLGVHPFQLSIIKALVERGDMVDAETDRASLYIDEIEGGPAFHHPDPQRFVLLQPSLLLHAQ